jgi:hypothetical protein
MECSSNFIEAHLSIKSFFYPNLSLAGTIGIENSRKHVNPHTINRTFKIPVKNPPSPLHQDSPVLNINEEPLPGRALQTSITSTASGSILLRSGVKVSFALDD